jgi:hypothetical protein
MFWISDDVIYKSGRGVVGHVKTDNSRERRKESILWGSGGIYNFKHTPGVLLYPR